MINKNLGHATAYAYYKAGGGTMTEAEFTEFMADFGTASQTAVEAAQAALASKNAAQTAATTATNKASEATTAAQTATTKAGEASQSASQASASAQTASTKASEASASATTASAKATEATTAAGTATTAKNDAVAAQTAAETAQGKAETAQEAAEAVAESIPSDYSQLSEDVSDLKEELIPLLTRYDADDKNAQNKTVTSIEWTDGHFYNLTTGEYSTSPVMKASPKYDCKVGDVILLEANQGQMLFFKADGSLSAPYIVTEYPAMKGISVPENTVQFAINNAGSNAQASAFTLYREVQELAVKKVIAPARLLFDSNDFANKQYISTANGALYKGDNYSAWYCLPFIKVEPSHKYRTETQTQIVFYDANMAFISALLPNDSAANTGVAVEMDFTTPANCAYISVNSQSAHELLFDVDEYDIVGQITNPQKLTGLNVLSFGDSITGNYAYGDNISSFVEDFTGAKTYNCGFGGCRMELLSGDSETAQITNPFAMCSIVDELAKPDSDSSKWSAQDTAAATFEASPRYNRIIKFRLAILKSIDITKIDIATIAYGTNEIGYTQENQSDPYDKYTFGGATRYSIEKLLELNPKLRIVLLTPIYRHDVSSSGNDSDSYVNSDTGLSMVDNINTLKSVGLEYKIPVIDLYHELGVNAENYTAYFGDDDETDDGTHINSYGRKMYGLRLAGELNRLL